MLGLAELARRHKPSDRDPNVRPIPPDVRARIERAERAIMPDEPSWEEALCFYDGDTYVEISAVTGKVVALETREGSVSKPRWRQRLKRNRHFSAIERLRSRFAARIPIPQCSAPSHNAEAINAAKLGEKVCLSLYRKLKIKKVFLDTMVYTFNCGAGYIWPYWNANIGRFIEDPGAPADETNPDGKPRRLLRTGECDFAILSPSEVLSEPGVPFDKSRWYAVRKAQPVSEVQARTDYNGPAELTPDATAAKFVRHGDPTTHELVFVYHFLERPCTKYPAGRWLQFANGAEIAPHYDYPHEEDVPVIHELADATRPHRDRPLGRGQIMVDIQRTYERTSNQILLWKNLALNPALLAPKGSIRKQRTGEPGETIEYRPIGGQAPQWMQVPEIPVGLFKILDLCIADWQEVTGESDLPAGLESGSAVAQVRNEKDESRRATFAENLASCYSSVFEHLLYLVQRHYTEPRLLEVKTRFGTESIPDFLGAKLMPGISVNVDPGSVQPRTREAQEAKLIMYAERGWIPPHQVMAALRAGDVDALIDEYELDVARAQRHIQQLIALGRGEAQEFPFAGPMDNHEVHSWLLGAWMKTEDFERQPEVVKQATLLLYDQHQAELMWQAFEQQMNTQATAESKGLEGAANGPVGGGGSPPPSLPSVESTVRGLQGIPQRAGT